MTTKASRVTSLTIIRHFVGMRNLTRAVFLRQSTLFNTERLKTRDLTSRDWTTRDHIAFARLDIARLI